jgi:hypothetical protein
MDGIFEIKAFLAFNIDFVMRILVNDFSILDAQGFNEFQIIFQFVFDSR